MHRHFHKLGKLLACGGLATLGWLAAQTESLSLGQTPAAKTTPLPDYDRDVVAHVNGVAITRREFGDELIKRRGKEQLELYINRKIIEQAAQKAGVIVTDADIDAELKEIMKKMAGLTDPAAFEKNVLKQRDRNSSLYEYKEDFIRPELAMRKLAEQRVKVTEEEIKKAFEGHYGEKVQCRVIVMTEKDLRAAQRTWLEVKDSEEAFLRVAKSQAFPQLAAVGGLNYVNRFSATPEVEKAAFKLADGETSHVIEVAEGYAIIRRERLVEADVTKKLENERAQLAKDIFDKKLVLEVRNLFLEIRKQAVVHDYLNNKFDVKDVMLRHSAADGTKKGLTP